MMLWPDEKRPAFPCFRFRWMFRSQPNGFRIAWSCSYNEAVIREAAAMWNAVLFR
jgi:hypothetical protein